MDSITLAWLLAFCRSASAFFFLQLPSARRTPAPTRIVFALLISVLIAPVWELRLIQELPATTADVTGLHLISFLLRELLTGICFGLTWSALMEIYGFGMQMLSIQAGFSYASMIDPTSEADSGLLLVIGQFVSLLALLGFGYHLEFLRAFLAVEPNFNLPGLISPSVAGALASRLLGEITTFALRISLPLISFLLIVDIVFVLLGKFNEKLQLISLSLGLKTLAALLLLSACLSVLPSISLRAIDSIQQRWTSEVLQLVR